MLTCVEDIVVYSMVVIIGAFAMSSMQFSIWNGKTNKKSFQNTPYQWFYFNF